MAAVSFENLNRRRFFRAVVIDLAIRILGPKKIKPVSPGRSSERFEPGERVANGARLYR